MLYAKSKPIKSIKEHIEDLLREEKRIMRIYGDSIKVVDKNKLHNLLKIACQYHDCGKVYTPFQNKILEVLGEEKISTQFSDDVKHEKLSPLFIPYESLNLNQEEIKILVQTIYYHHEREDNFIEHKLVEEIIQKDILPRYEYLQKELGIELTKNPNAFYLTMVEGQKRITQLNPSYALYCLVKGLLHRIDHSASAQRKIEDETKEKIEDHIETFMKENNYQLNKLQKFAKTNQNENLLVIGSTGMGKTEAGLLWSKDSKTFFTLPIRISINAIFDRIDQGIGYHHIGLLHSSSLDYLEEREQGEVIMQPYEIYRESQNLSCKITTCTIDQIFTFVFKYKGYEKMYATLAYSKVIIDEIQAYSPEIVAVILKGLQMIHQLGGKFMIMTATLPKIYKEKLEEYKIPLKYGQFIKDIKRHRLSIQRQDILKGISQIIQKSKQTKVLIIVNTVNKAIEIYLKLKEQKEENIHLLHSRFIQEDKNLLEKQIKEFSESKNTGIWITTQIVEASLDIDFDYLFTEMSTLDSLFQRLGRCYRSREYDKEESNIFIYTNELSGIGSVYDKEINEMSIKMIEKYDKKLISEEAKIELVDFLYSRENLENTQFYKEFISSTKILDYLIDYQTSKKEAQKMLRKIENLKVIPIQIYQKNIELLEKYRHADNYEEKMQYQRKIEKLTVNIREKIKYVLPGKIREIEGLKDIFYIECRYDKAVGLILENDNEFNTDLRIL